MDIEKFFSRKFLLAFSTQVEGLATLIWGLSAGETVATIAGAVIMVLVAVGYVKVEGDIDKSNKDE